MSARKKSSVRPPKNIDPMTIAEFRAKLEGIEMFQASDWVPTAEQWALIREMINKVVEAPHLNFNTGGSVPMAQLRQRPTSPSQAPNMVPASTLDAPALLPPVEADGAELANLPLSKIRQMQEHGMSPKIVTSKTPNIDTSGGDYHSPFSE